MSVLRAESVASLYQKETERHFVVHRFIMSLPQERHFRIHSVCVGYLPGCKGLDSGLVAVAVVLRTVCVRGASKDIP